MNGQDEPSLDPPGEHPLVKQLSRKPGAPVEQAVTLTGLFGESDDGDRVRLYFSPQLDQYAEFDRADAIDYQGVPAAQSPISGYDATRVRLKRGSRIEFTHVRTQSVDAHDQFDLDVRLANGPPYSTTVDTPTILTCGVTCDTRNLTPVVVSLLGACDDRTMVLTSLLCR